MNEESKLSETVSDDVVADETSSDDTVALTNEEQQFVDFAEGFDGEDEDESLEATDELEEVEVEAKQETAEPAKEPEGETGGEPAKAEAVTEPVTETPETPAEPKQPEVEQPTPVAEQQQPEQPAAPTQEEMQKRDAEFEERLAKELYALSDEENDAMLLEPKTVLPKLAARLHREVLTSAVNGVLAHVPRIVEQVAQQSSSQKELRTGFYGKWPKLVGHEATVAKIAQLYGQLNPQADVETTVRDVGLQAMLSLGLPVEGMGGTIQEEAGSVTQSTVSQTPANPGGGAGMVPRPPRSNNPFEALAEEFENEDY